MPSPSLFWLKALARQAVTSLLDTDATGEALRIPIQRDNNRRGAIKSPKTIAQVWLVARALLATLQANTRITQREIYYRVKPTGLFPSPAVVNQRIRDLSRALAHLSRVVFPRESLGVIAAPRGAMRGNLNILLRNGSTESVLGNDFPIPGDPRECTMLRFVASPARCVLIVEKETVFRRLVEDGLLQRYPCVLITSCGYPTTAARALVQHVVSELQLPCYGLADWNPHGMMIMLTYKFGGTTSDLEGHHCPQMQWIGLKHEDFSRHFKAENEFMMESMKIPFSRNDDALLRGLESREEVVGDALLLRECEKMRDCGFKLDLESLFSSSESFLSYVASKLLSV